jgi:peptidyl-dipeptidase A
MCAGPNFADFVSAHHELAHIQYYMHYAAQPAIFKEGANPGKHF